MKHIYFYIMVILLSFSNFGMIIHAQSPCESVSVEVIAMNPQSGPHNYFGVRVSLSQAYYQDVTVSGYIWNGPDEHGYNEDHPYTLTIVAGYLTAETAVTFFETSPAAEGAANITSVSPCPGDLPDSLIDVFKNVNTSILQNSDSNIVAAYLKLVNQEIKDCLTQRYPQYLPNDSIDVNDPMTILFGLTYAVAEATEFQPIDTTEISFLNGPNKNPSQNYFTSTAFSEINLNPSFLSGPSYNVSEIMPVPNLFYKNKIFRVPTWLRCIVDVTLGYFDVVGLINGLGTFEFGTVWTVVKFAVKKYVGWIGAAILLYDLATECL